jgi:prolyl oligopeptidase
MIRALLLAVLALPAAAAGDPYLWLEEVEGKKAIEWVKERNAASLGELEADPRYAPIKEEVRAILNASDRIPFPTWRGGWVYNFWQDAQSVRGLWRRARLKEYRKGVPSWQVVLDVDALGRAEGESWVYKGADCRAPAYDRCLLSLSRGGKDAYTLREFEVERATWAADGFALSEAKHRVAWEDGDTLLVGSDFGPGSLTKSGYPRLIRRWRRGTPLASAPQVFAAEEGDVMVQPVTFDGPGGTMSLLWVSKTFFEYEYHRLGADGAPRKLPFPRDSDLEDWDGRFYYLRLVKDWAVAGRTFKAGSLVAAPDDASDEASLAGRVELVYEPGPRQSLAGASAHRGGLYLTVRDSVATAIERAERGPSGWTCRRLPFAPHGTAALISLDPRRPEAFFTYSSFLTPTTLSMSTNEGRSLRALKVMPTRFDAKGLAVTQEWAKSADGTEVPYYLVRRKDAPRDGSTPTLLYGYGGFQVVYGPSYLEVMGKAWLEKGGAYALANIRGGGEFGPAWHQAALKEKRPRAFEDFAAVAEDLAAKKFTSPRRLGIMGGSNGGLLVGATMTRRPELMNAVVCQVPLLDMLRYHKLLAGHSWMGEYGDPEGAQKAAIAAYSPYQNAKAGVAYPRAFFVTSTKDDRVHPGHARKMVARLRELGADPLYYENIEGGHSAAADLEQRAKRSALEYAYLHRQLMD